MTGIINKDINVKIYNSKLQLGSFLKMNLVRLLRDLYLPFSLLATPS